MLQKIYFLNKMNLKIFICNVLILHVLSLDPGTKDHLFYSTSKENLKLEIINCIGASVKKRLSHVIYLSSHRIVLILSPLFGSEYGR